MKISVISFSFAGNKTGNLIKEGLSGKYDIKLFSKSHYAGNTESVNVKETLPAWTEAQFKTQDAIIFIGAAGIAVRAISPYVKSKKTDPAVIVIDEKGKFVISLLSGHIGGANELAEKIAEITNGMPVITTATDINKKFAVDVFAKKNNCYISDMKIAKEVSAAIVNGKRVNFESDYAVKGEVPEELKGNNEEFTIKITNRICNMEPDNKTLLLIPRNITAGIGCKKNTDKKNIEKQFTDACNYNGISRYSVEKIASIDLKKNEKGLIDFAKSKEIPFVTYTKEELEKIPGDFTESEFVKKITGISNVCERSAIADGNGKIIMKKYAKDGITIAFAEKEMEFEF